MKLNQNIPAVNSGKNDEKASINADIMATMTKRNVLYNFSLLRESGGSA